MVFNVVPPLPTIYPVLLVYKLLKSITSLDGNVGQSFLGLSISNKGDVSQITAFIKPSIARCNNINAVH